MTWQILQRQQSLCSVSALSLRLQSCSKSLCWVHFLYSSSLDTHQHSPHLTVSVSPNIMRHGKMRCVPSIVFTMRLYQGKSKVYGYAHWGRTYFSPYRFHTQQQQQSCSYTLWKMIFALTKALLPGFYQIQFSKPLCRLFDYNNL